MTTPALSQSAKLYQERKLPEDRTTRRLPSPRSNMDSNLVHSIPLSPPSPTPEVLDRENNKPPDSGRTDPWPWGVGEEDIQ
jgi:hypothetical protein